jgi:hypothetical protein
MRKIYPLFLALVLFSSCTALKELHTERMSIPVSQFRMQAISPLMNGYCLLSGQDDDHNQYSFIAKDIPHTLKIGDLYSMK